MTKLVIIRGLPGSGKTTMAQTVYKDFVHIDADIKFLVNGEFIYSSKQIAYAHIWCQSMVKESLIRGVDTVVSGIFVYEWEVEPYLNIAKNLRAEVQVVIASGNYPHTHWVPKGIVDRMRGQWEYIDFSKYGINQ